MQSLTLKGYLNNPMGKGIPIAGNQEAIKTNYLQQEEAIKDLIQLTWYNLKDKVFIAHLKIPSSNKRNTDHTLHYDVVLEFYADAKRSRSTIDEVPMKVFSNAPSFVFSYAHVFIKEKLLVDWAKDMYPREVVKKPPTEKNSYGLIGYEKSLYIACLYISMHCSSVVGDIKNRAILQSNTSEIHRKLQTSDEVLKKYKELPPLDKEIESKKVSKIEKDDSSNRGTTNVTQGIHSVKKVNRTKTVNHVKSVKRILKRK